MWLLDALVRFCYYSGVYGPFMDPHGMEARALSQTTLSNITVGTIRDDILLL